MKRGIPVVLFLIMFVLVSGCSTDQVQLEQSSQEIQDELCEQIQHGYYRDLCYKTVAIGEKNEAFCNMVVGRGTIQRGDFQESIKPDTCIGAVAAVKGDVNLCNQIDSYVKERCYAAVAEQNKDVTLCEEAGVDRDLCYSFVAEETLNDSYCESINYQGDKNLCYLNIGREMKDASFCEEVSDDYRERCTEEVNDLIDSNSLCNDTEYSKGRNKCLQVLAISEKDIEVCEHISATSPMWDCKVQFMDLDNCLGLNHPRDKNDCLEAFAGFTKDSSICFEHLRRSPDRCVENVAVALGDWEICMELEHSGGCLLSLAEKEQDSELCERIDSLLLKDLCLSKIPKIENCIKIEDEKYAGECFGEIVKSRYDLEQRLFRYP
jgi:hypothetical protein